MKSDFVGDESLAMIEIDVYAINLETMQFMKAQMGHGRDDGNDAINVVAKFDAKFVMINHVIQNISASVLQLCKEERINFASTQNIARFARHAAAIIAHPLQVVWIMSASFKASSVPRPKAFALRAEHLVTSVSLVNENLAIRARFCVVLQKSDRSEGIRIAHMVRIVACRLGFPAMRASVVVTCCTLPRGRDESIAVGMSAAMNELVVALVRFLW